LPQSQPPYSKHIFHFPFRIKKDEEYDFSRVQELLNLNDWELQSGNHADAKHYNQRAYFHSYAYEALFGVGGKVAKVFSLNNICNGTFDIVIKKSDTKKYDYRLTINSIMLRIYATNVGILSFNLSNFKQDCKGIVSENQSFEDILRINDYGRRLYPQFIEYEKKEELLNAVKASFLPEKVKVTLKKGLDFTANFNEFDSLKTLPKADSPVPDYIKYLLGGIEFESIVDDRMFTMCMAFDSKTYLQEISPKDKHKQNYLNSEKWHEFVFVDNGGATFQNPFELEALLKKHTYDRWAFQKYEGSFTGSLMGITRYSLMIMAHGSWFNEAIISKHFDVIYEPMVALCLAQRASLLSYSLEVATISQGLDTDSSKKINELYKSYIKFINTLSFREITAQEQGIEMYQFIKSKMGIDNETKDLDQEISELNQYVEIESQRKLSESQSRLSMAANRFLPAALVAAMLAFVSDKDYFQFNTINLDGLESISIPLRYVFLVGIVVATYFLSDKISSSNSKKNKK
jgi:hypothetical protein